MPFRKRTYSVRGLLSDAWAAARRAQGLRAVFVDERLPRDVREEVMLAVAALNDCRYCLYVHREWARRAGVDAETIAALAADLDVTPELRELVGYVRAFVDAGFVPIAGLRAALVDKHGAERVDDVETAAIAMTLSNKTGNTFDALLSRLRGDPQPDARVLDELAVTAVFLAAGGAVLLRIALAWRRSPVTILLEMFAPQRARRRSTISAK